MEAEIIGGEIGSEADYSLSLEGGKLKLEIIYAGGAADAGISLSLNPDYLLDKLAAVIPGEIDDAVFAIIKGALKA